MSEGSLLGAVRHHGFIPWDDDIDIMMTRENYNKFIELSERLPKGLCLDSFETNPKHWTICAKVLMTEETEFSMERLRGIALSLSPGIDIFALDNAPESDSELHSIGRRIRMYRVMLWLKSGYSNDTSTVKWKVLKCMSLFYSIKSLHKRIDALIKKYDSQPAKRYINYGSLYDVEKEVFDKEWFSEKVLIPFEDDEYIIPSGFDAILKKVYGNYMSMPSFSSRIPKHSYYKSN